MTQCKPANPSKDYAKGWDDAMQRVCLVLAATRDAPYHHPSYSTAVDDAWSSACEVLARALKLPLGPRPQRGSHIHRA